MSSEDISLSDLMPAGFPLEESSPDDDIVAVPESVEEKKQLEQETPEPPTAVQPVVEETAAGEVLPPLPATSTMTPKMMQAAYADAAGMDRKDIAKMVGVSESSIKQWRAMPEYQAEISRLSDGHAQDLELPLQLMQQKLIAATNEAIDTLQIALNAADDKGRPAWTTRLRAAEKLLDHGITLGNTKTATGNTPGGGLAPNASGAVVLILKD